MPFSTRELLAVALLPLTLSTAAVAQDEPPIGGPVLQAASAAETVSIQLRARGTFTFDADIDDTDGSVSIGRVGAGIGLNFKAWERARLSLGVDEEVSWYLFDDARRIIPTVPDDGDPFELGLTTTFSPRLSVQQNDQWSWFVGGIIEFSGDPDADLGDSGTYGGYAGARYAFSDTFGFTFGFAAKTRLEDDALVIPLVGLDWKVTDRVTVSTEGTMGHISAKLADQWSVRLSGGWELREYRLDDEGSLPDGVMSDSRVPIAISFEWNPSEKITLAVTGGAVVWQEFEFRDEAGDDVSEVNTDPAPFIGLSATFRF